MTAGELMVAQRVETREDLSFDEIFESYHERIYNCIYRLVGNPEEAHDLTQETFLRAYAGLPKNQVAARMSDIVKEKFAETVRPGVLRAHNHKIEVFLDSLKTPPKA